MLTDQILHHDGVAALAPYRVLITGSHPKYWSEPMLDAVEAFWPAVAGSCISAGMDYIGSPPSTRLGRTSSKSGVASPARGCGARPPGEGYHSTTGEPGGIWRLRGRPPQKLVGWGRRKGRTDPRPIAGARRAGTRAPNSSSRASRRCLRRWRSLHLVSRRLRDGSRRCRARHPSVCARAGFELRALRQLLSTASRRRWRPTACRAGRDRATPPCAPISCSSNIPAAARYSRSARSVGREACCTSLTLVPSPASPATYCVDFSDPQPFPFPDPQEESP